ncbi:MAG: hypothetical protein K2R98_20145 [Gemmataceae bacterium]|nr:hypothetical protein [Gemmataceae bacterium]
MSPHFPTSDFSCDFPSIVTRLPGPDRKRGPALYRYRMTFRSAEPTVAGCVTTWEVDGGRMPYQIALERDDAGNLKMHCTCADAVYRADGRFCKHIHGLLQLGHATYPVPSREERRGA